MLPIYKAIIADNIDGITAISFVQEPAVECGFMQFSKQKKSLKFSVIDEMNRKVIAPIMRCDFPIYRIDEYGNEYYIVYPKETIEVMARKMLNDNVTEMNQEHNPARKMDGVYLEELFIKNMEKGINPAGFEDIENYSLFGVYSIDSNSVWEAIQKGEFTGISLEGYFSYEIDFDDVNVSDLEESDSEESQDDIALWEEIFEMLLECKKRGIK